MTPAEMEKTKLIANAYHRLSTACFTVGLLTPIAGYVYNVSGFRSTMGISALIGGVVGWIVVAIGLHFLARRIINRIQP